MVRFAFLGRVSTEDLQNPVASRQWQLARAEALVAGHGRIVAEFFDVGQSRAVSWLRRPESARLLKALEDRWRGFEAVVIGEPQRVFYDNQFGLVFPLFVHFEVALWVPEVGGVLDPDCEGRLSGASSGPGGRRRGSPCRGPRQAAARLWRRAGQPPPARSRAWPAAWRTPRAVSARCWVAACRTRACRPGSARWRGARPCPHPGQGRGRYHRSRSNALSTAVELVPASPAASACRHSRYEETAFPVRDRRSCPSSAVCQRLRFLATALSNGQCITVK
jgi:hypothetical protein